MSRSDVEAAALAEFPELHWLIDLREAGWVFLPGFADGELIEVRGVHTWPGGWAEAIRAATPPTLRRCASTTTGASCGSGRARCARSPTGCWRCPRRQHQAHRVW